MNMEKEVEEHSYRDMKSMQPEKATWETSNQPLVFVICTLMMPRIHKLVRQAGELVYCDSTSSLDRYNCPTLIVMSTCTSAGSILLGVV